MSQNYDVKQEWEKTKKQLVRFGHEVGELVRKGEDEIIHLSQKGKIQIEATTTTLKKEKLYYQIGKEYVALSDVSKPSDGPEEIDGAIPHKLEREQKSLNTKLKKKSHRRTKTPKKEGRQTRRQVCRHPGPLSEPRRAKECQEKDS